MDNREHPDDKTIEHYILQELPENEEISLGEHFSECTKCAAKAARYSRFLWLWEHWSAAGHGEAFWGERIRQVLADCTKGSAVLDERITGWLKRWKGKVGGVIQFISTKMREATDIITSFPESLFPGTGRFNFAIDAPVRGATQEEPVIRLSSADGATLLWNRDTRSLLVKIPDKGVRPPVVVLISPEGRAEASVPGKVEGTAFYSAVFYNIDSDDFALILEPSDN